MTNSEFRLAERLEADTYSLAEWPLCRILLMDDARFPWIILVPKRADCSEIIELSEPDQAQLMREISQAMAALASVTRPDKINLGALGNIVRQLHVHLVARYASDPAWPGPVWGVGERRSYPPHMAGLLIDRLSKALGEKA
jgi:diadenosine tetraphosphate (Ap4A) HIT family hydrolase